MHYNVIQIQDQLYIQPMNNRYVQLNHNSRGFQHGKSPPALSAGTCCRLKQMTCNVLVEYLQYNIIHHECYMVTNGSWFSLSGSHVGTLVLWEECISMQAQPPLISKINQVVKMMLQQYLCMQVIIFTGFFCFFCNAVRITQTDKDRRPIRNHALGKEPPGSEAA